MLALILYFGTITLISAAPARPIDGAFGFQLGAELDVSDPRITDVDRVDQWRSSYFVLPEKLLAGFSTYKVTTDRIGRIMTIEAWGKPSKWVDAQSLEASLAALYQGLRQKKSSEPSTGGETNYFVIKSGRVGLERVINLTYWYDEKEGTGWALLYVDRELAMENLTAQTDAIRRENKLDAEKEIGDTL